jgi:hypothetical protein
VIKESDRRPRYEMFLFSTPVEAGLVVFRPLIDPQAQYCNFLCREGLWWAHGRTKAIFNHHI